MKFVLLFAVALAAVTGRGQTLHVTEVRHWQPTDPAPVSRAFEVWTVSADMDGKHYQLQQMKSWGSLLVQVGGDYPVLKVQPRAVEITIPDKKGKPQKERLDIMGVSEDTPQK